MLLSGVGIRLRWLVLSIHLLISVIVRKIVQDKMVTWPNALPPNLALQAVSSLDVREAARSVEACVNFLSRGADVDLRDEANMGFTALHYGTLGTGPCITNTAVPAAKWGLSDVMKVLFDAGATPGLKTWSGHTAR